MDHRLSSQKMTSDFHQVIDLLLGSTEGLLSDMSSILRYPHP